MFDKWYWQFVCLIIDSAKAYTKVWLLYSDFQKCSEVVSLFNKTDEACASQYLWHQIPNNSCQKMSGISVTNAHYAGFTTITHTLILSFQHLSNWLYAPHIHKDKWIDYWEQAQDQTRFWWDLIVQSQVLQAAISIVKICFCLGFKIIEEKTNKLTNTKVNSWEFDYISR